MDIAPERDNFLYELVDPPGSGETLVRFMHISDGILNETAAGTTILVVTSGLAAIATAIGLKKMDYEKAPRSAVLSAAFFVASLIHIKIGVTSVHLVLNGLVGIILGWAAFPAFLIALFLQTIFFGHGGITVLGLNTFNFGVSSLICYYAFGPLIRRSKSKNAVFVYGFMAGTLSLVVAAMLIVAELMITGESFQYLAEAFLIAHIPVAIIEGFVIGFTVTFLKRVKPDLLQPSK